MGNLCSTVHKTSTEVPMENKHQTSPHPSKYKRLHKMKSVRHSGPHSLDWRAALDNGLETQEAYEAARNDLQREEMARAFDAEIMKDSSSIERQAVEIVKRIRWFDKEQTYGSYANAIPSEKRSAGQHFLGNVDLISQTELFKIAKRMPKGSHLHIHFNSCLPAAFLIRQARHVGAMYIRSTRPLTSPENMAASRISFMVMTLREATHHKGSDGSESYAPLGDLLDPEYRPNTWMRYTDFQKRFKIFDQIGQVLEGTHGAEYWLETKMQISEEEAHNSQQTGRG